jgi:hypothetical protein
MLAGIEIMDVIELRQYLLHPGRRDELIDLFDRHLVEPQEACGMRILGQFRDRDRPDLFVWLRGFSDMTDRTRALGAFYSGPVWAQHRAAANATMIDSDNVLLLRRVPSHDPCWETDRPIGLVEIVVRAIAQDVQERELARIDWSAPPDVRRLGGSPIAVLATEPAPNGFPALPVREGECVVVTVLGFSDAAHQRLYRERVPPADDTTQLLRLRPTERSRLGRSSHW